MTFGVVAEASAKRDWAQAVDWYEESQPGTGLRFDGVILRFLKSLSRNPERFRRATRLTRKAKMPRPWPYSIYFTIDRNHREVTVLAIWHGARSPAQLRQ